MNQIYFNKSLLLVQILIFNEILACFKKLVVHFSIYFRNNLILITYLKNEIM